MHRSFFILLLSGTVLAIGGLFSVIHMGTPATTSPAPDLNPYNQGVSADRISTPLNRSGAGAEDGANRLAGAKPGFPSTGTGLDAASRVLDAHTNHVGNTTSSTSKRTRAMEAEGSDFAAGERNESDTGLDASSAEHVRFLDAEEELALLNGNRVPGSDVDDDTAITTDPSDKLARKQAKKEKEASEPPSALKAFQVALGYLGTDKYSPGKVVRAVQAMDESEFPAAAAQIQHMEWNRDSHDMMNALMKQWGKVDLDGALQAADQLGIRRMRNDAMREVMSGWSSHNPEAAYNMLLAGEEREPLAEHLSPASLFKDLAKINAQGALDKVWNLPSASEQNAALAGVLSAIESNKRHETTRSLYQQAPTVESKNMLARAVVNDLRIYQPHDAAAFVDTIQEPDIRKSAAGTLLGSWAADDPTEAMAWAASHPPGDETKRDIGTVASRWARDDRRELAGWLNQQPATSTLDPAVVAMVRNEQKESPASAMGWAESIVDPKNRVSNIRSVAAAWLKTDPAAATPYIINHAELTEKDKQRLFR